MKLRICELNAENLFISLDYREREDLGRLGEAEWRALALAQLRKKQKPLAKLWCLAEAIQEIDPDILMLSEVGGRDSLENLNRHFLGERFSAHFVEGNSKRGIDLGFLVRRGLGLEAEALSNRDTPVEVSSFHGKMISRFSRDVAELRLRDGAGLRLILLLTHLKSMISTEQDPRGKDARTAEAIALAGIYERLRGEHPDVPIVVGGDFNAHLESLELELLKRADLADFHDLLGTPPEERVSLVHFDHADRPHGMVLDYLLVSPHLRGRIVAEESLTFRYRPFPGLPGELPRTRGERHRLPSDHYPLVLTLRL